MNEARFLRSVIELVRVNIHFHRASYSHYCRSYVMGFEEVAQVHAVSWRYDEL